jgi:carbon monoxide dehydrogenase subunit G
MRIDNSFLVDLPVEQAWGLLNDIPSLVPCMPGAALLAVEDDRTYRGQVTVRLGPVTVTFQGRARIEELDAAAQTVRVKASGNEAKGRGSAQAEVRFAMHPDGAGTRVEIATDLTLAGAVAQYGRAQGVIADVAQAVIDSFAENLRRKIAAAAPATAPGPAAPAIAASEASAPTSPVPPRPAALSLGSVLLAVLRRWLARITGRAVPR